MVADTEIFSDAHPEYLDDDSDTVTVADPVQEKPAQDEAPPATNTEQQPLTSVKDDWILKLAIVGFGFVFVMWLVSRRRSSAYEALKQDEKSTA